MDPKTADLFPAELKAAQSELADAHPYEDDKREFRDEELRYWFWDDNDYAEMVCQRRWGPI